MRSCSRPRSRSSRRSSTAASGERRSACWGATIGAAVAIGPLAGGMLTSWLSWRWIFLVNIPIGIGAVLLGSAKLHESKDPDHARLDPPGLITLTGGLLCLILGLIEGSKQGWTSTVIIALFVAAIVLLALFVVTQATERVTMIDLTLFTRPGVRRRAGHGVRDLLDAVRDVPLHHAVPAEHPRPLAAPDRRPVPAAQPARVRRRAARRTPLDAPADPCAASAPASLSVRSRCS